MTKKVLILSGSPRKQGNSDLLCDEFMRGALEVKMRCVYLLGTPHFALYNIFEIKSIHFLKKC